MAAVATVPAATTVSTFTSIATTTTTTTGIGPATGFFLCIVCSSVFLL